MRGSVRNVQSPEHVRQIVRSLIHGKTKVDIVLRQAIPTEDLTILDAFTREVFESDDCQVLSFEGCNSCCADGISGSLAHSHPILLKA